MTGSNSTLAFFALALVLAAASPAAADMQDLFDRAESGRAKKNSKSTAEGRVYLGRDRLDLTAGARIPTSALGDRGAGKLSLGGDIESDFACGKFDIKANLKALISKESQEDFLNALLGAAESELAYNALMLLAETSPTAFQLFQHWRISANAMLGMQYDRCQAIEQAISDGMKSIQAKAMKDCVEEMRQNGASMDEALRACERSDEIRSLSGEKVKELDLTDELKKLFNISDVDFQHLEKLLSKIRITKGGASGEIKADAVLEEYERLEKEFYQAWVSATDTLATNPNAKLTEDQLAKLAPPWAARPLAVELAEFARIPSSRRRILLESVARQAALLQLTVQVQELERWLEAEAQHPKMDEARVRQRQQEARALRLQMAHIGEVVRRQEEYNAALLSLSGAGQREKSQLASEGLYRAMEAEASRQYLDIAPQWGSISSRTKACDTSKPDCGKKKTTTSGTGSGYSSSGFGDVDRK